MHRFNYLLLALFTVFISSCGDDDACTLVTGGIINETREVPSFHSVSLDGVGDIYLTQGSPQLVTIETHQSILNRLTTKVNNEELHIELQDCIEGSIDQLDIRITIPDIERLDIAGVANIIGQNAFDLDDLELVIEGVGGISMFGTTDRLKINSSGIGNVQVFQLNSNSCEVNLQGAGNVDVTAQQELNVVISGSGNVSFRGTPTINSNISGSGMLIDAN